MKYQILQSETESVFNIATEIDSLLCSRASAAFASKSGLDKAAQWAVATVVSELVTNVVKFAGRGTLILRRVTSPRKGMEIVVEDEGPGIADLQHALVDGFSEGKMLSPDDYQTNLRGLGLGLGAVQRLMDHFSIENRAEGGLRVSVAKFINA